ncbi:MAG: phenylacetate--CoA ligase family protein [Ignavibacteria bacterium]|nr:phenylacetate--CoA ligase family protein [Ignavibacteria bacterium]
MTKDTIRTNIRNGKLLATNLNKASLIPSSSSGSTGEPLQFYKTKDSYSLNIAANLRGWYNMGYRLGDSYVKLSVNPRSSRIKKIQDRVNSCFYFSSEAVTEASMREFVELLVKNRPKFIRGYPSTLSLLGKYLASSGADIPELIAVNTTGEILFPEMRQIIERAFCCPVFDSYSGEGGANMFEFSKGKYFVSNEYAITEVIDDQGRAITNGEGEIVTTDLWNYANPFIRYAVKDKVVIDDNESECCYLRVSRVLGRSVDMLELSNGRTMIVHFFTGFFEWEKSVSQFQVIQTAPNVVEIKLVVNDYFNSREETKIHNRVKEYVGEGVALTLSLVDDIPVSKNGKRRFMFKKF